MGLAKHNCAGHGGGSGSLIGKDDLRVGNCQPGFVDHEGRISTKVVGEGDLPRTFASPAMLNVVVKKRVTDDRQQKCQNEVLKRPI